MQIRVIRYNHDKESTAGLVAINHEGKGHEGAVFECYCLEDQRQPGEKVMGETRIPAGTYKVGFQEQITGLTKKYRSRYSWFDKHLHIKDVQGFTGIYIHVGNTEKHTMGCLLLADKAVNDPKDYASVQETSTVAYKRFYEIVSAALKRGEEVEITYKSIWE